MPTALFATLTARYEAAGWQGRAAGPGAAIEGFRSLVADLHRYVGADHPATLAARGRLADWLGRGR